MIDIDNNVVADVGVDYDALFALPVYGVAQSDKEQMYGEWLSKLTRHHRARCEAYRRVADLIGDGEPLPVRLFKEFELRSVGREEVVKTMTSSGTSGQAVSRIFLDRDTSARQSKALARIVSDFAGKARLPMLVIDAPSTVKNRALFSARGAGILGFSMLGRDVTYALDDGMNLDWAALDGFCERHAGERVLLFGFTFMVWSCFVQALRASGRSLPLQGLMIHGGGWKKLSEERVSAQAFRDAVAEVCGVETVLNYYGMVEQTGSIFMECEHGVLHASVFSDVKIRDPWDFSELGAGRRGLIECDSPLAASYPGHRLLTEDEGELLGVDDCPCGRLGRYFAVHGRVKGAEIRGCSDTFARGR